VRTETYKITKTKERAVEKDVPQTFSAIPMDCCPNPKCDGIDELWAYGLPVAVSGIEKNRTRAVIRYVCPQCRLVWDCDWNLTTRVVSTPSSKTASSATKRG